MRTTCIVLVVLAGLACQSACGTASPFWHIQGQEVIDASGRPVMMRGINVGNWLLWEGWMLDAGAARGTETRILNRLSEALGRSGADEILETYQRGYITEDDVAAMAAASFNVMRVPLNWRALVSVPDCVACDGRGFDHLDQVIQWSGRHGMHVIIDMHAVPGAQSPFLTADPPSAGAQYWKDPEDQKTLVELWHAVAQHYATSNIVVGYDLINEPDAPSGAALLDAYHSLIAAVRAVDPNHIIWLEGNRFATDLSVFQEPLGPNVGYSSHVYIVGHDRRQEKLAEAAAAAHRLDAPVWIGEFGQSSYEITHSTVAMMASTPGLVGWAYWTWKRAASSDPAPCPLHLPAAWTDVSPWIGAKIGAAKPARQKVAEGASALLHYVDGNRCVPDPQLLRALEP